MACGSRGPTLRAGATCEELTANVDAVLVAKEPALAGLARGYRARCAADGWSDAAKGCYATPQTYQEMVERCPPLLTKAQRRALMDTTLGPGTGDQFVK